LADSSAAEATEEDRQEVPQAATNFTATADDSNETHTCQSPQSAFDETPAVAMIHPQSESQQPLCTDQRSVFGSAEDQSGQQSSTQADFLPIERTHVSSTQQAITPATTPDVDIRGMS
jgi:hypothetical protein